MVRYLTKAVIPTKLKCGNPQNLRSAQPALAASRLEEQDEAMRRESDYDQQRTAYFVKSRL